MSYAERKRAALAGRRSPGFGAPRLELVGEQEAGLPPVIHRTVYRCSPRQSTSTGATRARHTQVHCEQTVSECVALALGARGAARGAGGGGGGGPGHGGYGLSTPVVYISTASSFLYQVGHDGRSD